MDMTDIAAMIDARQAETLADHRETMLLSQSN
jgi:hypothetical protein